MNVREWALPVYTILMQLAAGTLLILWLIRSTAGNRFKHGELNQIIRNPILVIVFTTITAMLGTHFHLSKPWLSFLALLNLKSSWLSREILTSILFLIAIGSLWLINRYKGHKWTLQTLLGWLAIFLGLIVIYSISRVYMLPTQGAWNLPTVMISFYVTTLLLGVMALVCLLMLDLKYAEFQKPGDMELHTKIIKHTFPWLLLSAVVLVIFDIAITYWHIFFLQKGDITVQTSLKLLLELYNPILIMRLLLLLIAPAFFGFATYQIYATKQKPQAVMTHIYISCLLTLVAEILGRFLFYATHIRLGV